MSEEEKKEVVMPRTFATQGYLREMDKGTYMLYRNIEVEHFDKQTGKTTREKVNEICISPKPLREKQPGEEKTVVLRSHHPTENRPLELVEVD